MGRTKKELEDIPFQHLDPWQQDEIVNQQQGRRRIMDDALATDHEPRPQRERVNLSKRGDKPVTQYRELKDHERNLRPGKTDWTRVPMDYQARTLTRFMQNSQRWKYMPDHHTDMYGFAKLFIGFYQQTFGHYDNGNWVPGGVRIKAIRVSGVAPRSDRDSGWINVDENWFTDMDAAYYEFINICEDYLIRMEDAVVISESKHHASNMWEDTTVGHKAKIKYMIEHPDEPISYNPHRPVGESFTTTTHFDTIPDLS